MLVEHGFEKEIDKIIKSGEQSFIDLIGLNASVKGIKTKIYCFENHRLYNDKISAYSKKIISDFEEFIPHSNSEIVESFDDNECFEMRIDIRNSKGAESGHSMSQNALAWCYKNGLGVEQDYSKAFYWFEKSANLGLGAAQYNLGLAYEEGKGVETDLVKSREWFEKAAEQGEKKSFLNLAIYYENGWGGLKKNTKKATEYYLLSAKKG